jgi:hypothetical protein
VTARSVAIGLFFAVFFCSVTLYNDFKVGATFIAETSSDRRDLHLFFFAFIVNSVLRRVAPAKSLSPRRLLTIWVLILTASGLPSSGLCRYLIPNIARPAVSFGRDKQLAAEGLGGTPSWLRLSDPAAAEAYIHGYPLGQERVPWGAWAIPLVLLGILAACFLAASFCFANLLRPVDRE